MTCSKDPRVGLEPATTATTSGANMVRALSTTPPERPEVSPLAVVAVHQLCGQEASEYLPQQNNPHILRPVHKVS